MAKPSGILFVGGQRHRIDAPVVNFTDDERYNAHQLRCTSATTKACPSGIYPFAQYRSPAQRAAGIEATKRANRFRPRRVSSNTYVRQFVVHLDGCADALSCMNVLHNERGLSCHFIVDNDGTIYQTLDLIYCAYHAAGLNETSIGVELSNRGDAKKYPGFYDRRPIKRDLVSCTIHGHRYLAYGFTEMQYDSMSRLALALTKLLPNIKLDYPKGNDGKPVTTVLPDFARWQGYLGHYHIERQKWDPGPWDWAKMMKRIAGRRSFPIGLPSRQGKIEIPSKPEEIDLATEAYYQNNESEGQGGGYYPVGPWKPYRLWHSGVHLHAQEGDKVVAPLKGVVVAGRMGPIYDSIGSTNFALIRHEERIGSELLTFYSLYMHLAQEDAEGKNAPKWLVSEGFGDAEPGSVVVLDPPQPIQAGEVIGRVGQAGPEAVREPQLHFEIFMDRRIPKSLDPDGEWEFLDGFSDGVFCRNEKLAKLIDTRKKDGVFDHEEITDFYGSGSDEVIQLRKVIAHHLSEWVEATNWEQELDKIPDLKDMGLKPSDVKKLVSEQITPTIWWTESVAERLKLPRDGRIYNVHPITFLSWLQKKLIASGAEDEMVKLASAEDIRTAKAGTAKDDLEDDGGSMINDEDIAMTPETPLELEDLIQGWGDEEK